MQKIQIYIEDSLYPRDLLSIFASRLRSQDRQGNNSGTLYFSPTILCTLLKEYDKKCQRKGSFMNWIENSLKSVYFELVTGEIVPLTAITELHLKEQKADIVSSQPLVFESPIKLSNMPNLSQSSKSDTMYEVYLCRNNFKEEERVYLGDELNLAKGGVEDLTLDHIVTTYDMREQYHDELVYISKLDALIRYNLPNFEKIKGLRKQCQAIAQKMKQQIDFDDQDAFEGIVKELALIVRATRGIRVCSSRVNKLSV